MLNYLLHSVTFQKTRILNINTAEVSDLARISVYERNVLALERVVTG